MKCVLPRDVWAVRRQLEFCISYEMLFWCFRAWAFLNTFRRHLQCARHQTSVTNAEICRLRITILRANQQNGGKVSSAFFVSPHGRLIGNKLRNILLNIKTKLLELKINYLFFSNVSRELQENLKETKIRIYSSSFAAQIGKYLHWIHSPDCKFISFVVYEQRLTYFWFICFCFK